MCYKLEQQVLSNEWFILNIILKAFVICLLFSDRNTRMQETKAFDAADSISMTSIVAAITLFKYPYAHKPGSILEGYQHSDYFPTIPRPTQFVFLTNGPQQNMGESTSMPIFPKTRLVLVHVLGHSPKSTYSPTWRGLSSFYSDSAIPWSRDCFEVWYYDILIKFWYLQTQLMLDSLLHFFSGHFILFLVVSILNIVLHISYYTTFY